MEKDCPEKLVEALLTRTEGSVYATSRTTNELMQRTLMHFGCQSSTGKNGTRTSIQTDNRNFLLSTE